MCENQPGYPREQRCLGAECSCKRYYFNPLNAAQYPRRYKRKDPFACRGNRNDRWCCTSPCNGGSVHFSVSEPYKVSSHSNTLTRDHLVSETSEVLLWYAQLTGKLWLGLPGYRITNPNDRCGERVDAYPLTVKIIDIEVTFERAFSQWRHLVMSRGYRARQPKRRQGDSASTIVELTAPSSSPDEEECGEYNDYRNE